ncbi:putative Flavin-containing monooxygenase FMO GS-OX3 [Hypsibius exemplaris]|uniref:Flavin-containing monooxygenase n=1 Tax=Hypsibius exemplaris TaxID=2072580 RepID=A0A9X6RMR6_HYPEX|nr:putative Flavin-containing monooxygenase FMO GS-OX3 [Hypsibius exemplaris]
MEPLQRKRVAVIGAGVAGLCTLRHFSPDADAYSVVAFEQQGRIGGTWNYPTGCEEHPDAPDSSPMYCRVYRDLRTNTPRAINHLRDLDLPDGTDNTYVHRSVVAEHIQNYASHFRLLQYIKFNHRVISVSPADPGTACPPSGPSVKWKLLVECADTKSPEEYIFDAVFICNGHHNKPFIPEVPELKAFRGPVIHSSAYRTPDTYRNQTVLIVGAGASANDIVCELMHVANKVIILKKASAGKKYPDSFTTVQEVSDLTATPTGVVLPDGTPTTVDCVILCTGFQLDLPFITAECRLDISRGRVAPLYRHMINCKYPSMIFIGLLTHIPFLGAGPEDQILFCKAFLDGRVRLPSEEDMTADCERDWQGRLREGLPAHKAHMMRTKLWPYCRQLAEEAGFPPHDPVIERIHAASNRNVVGVPYDFRNYRIDKVDAETFTYGRRVKVLDSPPLPHQFSAMGNCLRRGEPSEDYSLLHTNAAEQDNLGAISASHGSGGGSRHQSQQNQHYHNSAGPSSSSTTTRASHAGSSFAAPSAEYRSNSPEGDTHYSSMTVERQLTEDDQRKLAQRFGLIQHLPSGLYDGGKKDRECPICMVELNCGDPVRFLPCMHVYHKDCIDDWLLKHSLTCPNCMEPVDSALLNSYEVGRTPWEFT